MSPIRNLTAMSARAESGIRSPVANLFYKLHMIAGFWDSNSFSSSTSHIHVAVMEVENITCHNLYVDSRKKMRKVGRKKYATEVGSLAADSTPGVVYSRFGHCVWQGHLP